MRRYELEPTQENIINCYQNYLIDRNEEVNYFIKFIDEIESNYVINVNSEWGNGKTFFIKQVEYLLKNPNDIRIISNEIKIPLKNTYNTFYYNVWQNDYHQDPLLSILFLLIKEFKIDDNVVNEKNLLNNLVKGLSNILPFMETVDLESYKAKNILEDVIETNKIYDAAKKIIELIFEKENKDKLVVFIDELERSSPQYSIKLLERIKHFFNNDKVIFVFATEIDAFCSVIKSYYGTEFNAELYLNKFFDKSILLENKKNLDYFFNNMGVKQTRYFYDETIKEMDKTLKLSLRDYNRISEDFKKVRNIEGKENYQAIFNYIIFPMLLIFKIKMPLKYNQICNKNKESIEYLCNLILANKNLSNNVKRLINYELDFYANRKNSTINSDDYLKYVIEYLLRNYENNEILNDIGLYEKEVEEWWSSIKYI